MTTQTYDLGGTSDFDAKSLKELMRDFSQDSMTLVRQETELFKKEMEGRIHKLERNAGMFGAGGVLAFTGLLVLTAALILGLNHVMPDWAAALLVGAVYIVAALVLLMRGKKEMSRTSMTPDTTVDSVKQDVRTLREAMHRG